MSVARQGDPESHACFVTSGSSNVLINGQPAARQGDGVCCALTFAPHPSPGTIVGASGSVLINGQPAAKNGDLTQHVTCGTGIIQGGSTNVIV